MSLTSLRLLLTSGKQPRMPSSKGLEVLTVMRRIIERLYRSELYPILRVLDSGSDPLLEDELLDVFKRNP